MKSNSYGLYGFVIAVGVGAALWAGLPIYLLFVLACPLMMFFMMRGMHGGQDSHQGNSDHDGQESPRPADAAGHSGKSVVDPSLLDGSHERIDRP